MLLLQAGVTVSARAQGKRTTACAWFWQERLGSILITTEVGRKKVLKLWEMEDRLSETALAWYTHHLDFNPQYQ